MCSSSSFKKDSKNETVPLSLRQSQLNALLNGNTTSYQLLFNCQNPINVSNMRKSNNYHMQDDDSGFVNGSNQEMFVNYPKLQQISKMDVDETKSTNTNQTLHEPSAVGSSAVPILPPPLEFCDSLSPSSVKKNAVNNENGRPNDEQEEDEEERNADGRSEEPPDDEKTGNNRSDNDVIVIEDDEDLPWGWQKRMSRTSGKPYYLNLFSKKSQWQAPSSPGWISPTRSESEWPKVRCSHVLIRHKDSRRPFSWRGEKVERTLEDAIQMAWTCRELLVTQQTNFEEAASRWSDCGSARQGGDLGWFTRGHMQRAFEEQAFQLKLGEICEAPVITKTGVHIIRRTA